MVKIAIVGVGNISQSHIEGILMFPDKAQIVALCDINLETIEKRKNMFPTLKDVPAFSNHKEMITSGVKIDLVHVCTPPYTHAPISIDCMDAGMNVFVEKPMATCIKECDDMLEAEKRNNVTLAVVAQNRFRDTINRLRVIAHSGTPGKIRCAHVNSFWWRGHSYYDLWWRGTWEKEGGGPTLNHAVHHIDMLNWIIEGMPKEVTSVLTNVMHDNSEVEDLSFATLKYEDGAVALVTSSVIHHGEEQGIVLQCADAKIAAPFSVAAEVSQRNGFPQQNTSLINEITEQYNSIPALPYEGHAGQINELIDALIEKRPPAITGVDGKNTIELITAIYKAGFLKKTITLPIKPDDEFYTFDGILNNAIYFYEKAKSETTLGDDQITVGKY